MDGGEFAGAGCHKVAAEHLYGFFFDAGDIGPRNTQPLCHLPLGQGLAAPQAVPQGDDLPFPGVQEGVDILPQLGGFQLEVDLAHHVHLLAHDIHEGEAVPLPVGVHRLAEADIRGGLAAGAEVHEDLICYLDLDETIFL